LYFEVADAVYDDYVFMLISAADSVSIYFSDVGDACLREIILVMRELVLGISV
jgi:hypothetical protein